MCAIAPWKDQSERPGGEHLEQCGVTTKKRSEVVSPGWQHQVRKDDATVCGDSDGKPVWKRVLGRRRAVARGQPREFVDGHRAGRLREIGNLFSGGREPAELRVGEHAVEHHQALRDTGRGDRPAIPTVRFVDGSVQREMMHVIEPAAIVSARVGRSVPAADELVEEHACLLSVDDAGERRVLP